MCTKIEVLSEALKQEGYRFTRQRRIILEELQKQEFHPRAQEIYEAVKARLPSVSLGTVYRNLGILVELGLVRKVDHGEYSRFDANLSDHYHLICTSCDWVFDVGKSILQTLHTRELETEGFEINGYSLELYGLCPNCRELRRS